MTKFCDFENIYWKNPFSRFFWEVWCSPFRWTIIGLFVFFIVVRILVIWEEEK